MKKALRILAIGMIVTYAFYLAGCGLSNNGNAGGQLSVVNIPDSEGSVKKEEKVSIRVVSFCVGEDPFRDSWQKALGQFQEQNPNVEIIDESTPSANDALRTKVKTDFASGNEPDLTWFFNGMDAKPLIESGKLFEFDDEIKRDEEWSSHIKLEALEAGRQYGKIYSIPIIGFYQGLFCNKDLFDQYGMKIPMTYEDMDRAIEVFKANDIVPIAASMEESYYIIENFVLSAAGKEGHRSEFQNTVPQLWVDGFNAIKDYYERGAFPKDALTISDDNSRNLFFNKRAAMMVHGSWCVGQLNSKEVENTVITYFPVIKGGKANYGDIIGGYGTGFFLSKELNNKKHGIPLKLLKFMSSPEVVRMLAKDSSIVGLDIETAENVPFVKEGREFYSGASSVSFPFGDRIDKEAFTNMRKNLAYVLLGKKTAQELLEESLRFVSKGPYKN